MSTNHWTRACLRAATYLCTAPLAGYVIHLPRLQLPIALVYPHCTTHDRANFFAWYIVIYPALRCSTMENHDQSSSDDVSKPQPPDKTFVYAPLDHDKASIRLIRVLATRTHEGYIQCEIRHASIDDSYICLSYLWGEPGDEHCIAVNNRTMRIRNNLFDFLERAAKNDWLRKESLWIDALCIDQENVVERNFQVQQMGRIFSCAEEVVSWFGEDKDSIAEYFVEHLSRSEGAVNYRVDIVDNLFLKFAYAPYWNRAWITQEVQLAQKVTLLARNVKVDYRQLLSSNRNLLIKDSSNPHWIVPPRPETWLPIRSLIHVMSEFGYKRCHDIRDRVYSLLALCDDGSDVQVDYNTSVERLARHTLECCGHSFCLCSMRIVHDVLHLGQQLSHGPLEDGSSEPFAYMTLPYYQGSLPSSKCAMRPCIIFECDGTTLSHTSGFVHQSSQNDDPSITIYPGSICGSVFHNLIKIRMVAVGKSRYRCDKARFSGSVMPQTWYWDAPNRGRHHHLVLTLSEDTCRIDFQFSTLIEIARDLVEAEPCGIVKSQDAKLGQPVLRLCSSPE